MPSPRRRPIAQRSGVTRPTLDAFLAGAAVDAAEWPFSARVLLGNALRSGAAGYLDAASAEYRSALTVADRAERIH